MNSKNYIKGRGAQQNTDNRFLKHSFELRDDFLEFFDTTQANVNNHMGMCFDIPHSFITNGSDFLKLPDGVLDHLTSPKGYIHISGGTTDEDTHYPLLTEGDLPFQEVKDFLEEKVLQYNNYKFIESDPISIPHKYELKEDTDESLFN